MKRFVLCLLVVLLFFSTEIACLASSLPYVGNKTTKVYHMVECTWGQKIELGNRIYFNSRENAERRGYRRCHYCGDGIVANGNGGGSSNNKKPASNSSTTDIGVTSKADDTSNGIHPLFWVAGGILLAWAIHCFVQIKRQEKEDEKNALAIQESNQKVLQSLNCESISIPKGIALLPDGTPTRGYTSSYRPYGEYTVYISPKGTRYHTSYRCCPNGTPTHLFKIPKHLLPCRNCASNMQYKQLVPSWYSELTDKTKIKNATVSGRTSIPEGVTPITLKSSFVMTAAYAEPVLYLTFKDGSRYAYYQVPPSIYEELINAQSPGKYFQEKIHNVYPYM